MTPEQVNQLIRTRRSIYPNMYSDKPIPNEIIWEILENGNWAPTHRKTEPWRFKVFTGAAKQRLAQFLADQYKANTPSEKFKEMKYKKVFKKAEKAYCMVVICMKRDEKSSVPEVEETNAVACAVQNMWLSAHAYNVGTYWSSPGTVYRQAMNDFLNIGEQDKCLGLMYMGYHNAPALTSQRGDISEKVEWFGA